MPPKQQQVAPEPQFTCSLRCPFSYFGSKSKLCSSLVNTLSSYKGSRKFVISPFCGSAVVELNMALANPGCTVVCYDQNPHVVNFHVQAQTNHKELMRRIHLLLKKDATRPRHYKMFHNMQGKTVQDAAEWYWCSRYSFNGKVFSYALKTETEEAKRKANVPEYPPNIRFHCRDSLEMLEKLSPTRLKNIIMYVDPPYMQASAKAYENANTLKVNSPDGFDHARLAAVLETIRQNDGLWVLSYGVHDDVQKLYRRYKKVNVTIPVGAWKPDAKVMVRTESKEFVIVSALQRAPAAVKA